MHHPSLSACHQPRFRYRDPWRILNFPRKRAESDKFRRTKVGAFERINFRRGKKATMHELFVLPDECFLLYSIARLDQDGRMGRRRLLEATRDGLFYFAFRIERVEFDRFRCYERQIASDSSVMYGFDRVAEHHETDRMIDSIKVLNKPVPVGITW